MSMKFLYHVFSACQLPNGSYAKVFRHAGLSFLCGHRPDWNFSFECWNFFLKTQKYFQEHEGIIGFIFLRNTNLSNRHVCMSIRMEYNGMLLWCLIILFIKKRCL